jgi:hypothetical protein
VVESDREERMACQKIQETIKKGTLRLRSDGGRDKGRPGKYGILSIEDRGRDKERPRRNEDHSKHRPRSNGVHSRKDGGAIRRSEEEMKAVVNLVRSDLGETI